MEAYTKGVSTRKVDALVKSMGADSGLSKSEVSRICKELDNSIAIFKNRKFTKYYPYVYFDATYIKTRVNESVQSVAVVVAFAIDKDGFKEILGFDIGNTESEEFWSEFIGSLNERGLKGVKLVITDAHAGLKAAISKKLIGSVWQRCKVHFLRNIIARIPKKMQPIVLPTIKTIFSATTKIEALENFDQVVKILNEKCPEAADMLVDAKDDVLAYLNFPENHYKHISSSNLLERFNKEIKRRSNVVEIFPNKESVRRLIGSLILEQNDEWIAEDRRHISQASMDEMYEKLELQEKRNLREVTV